MEIFIILSILSVPVIGYLIYRQIRQQVSTPTKIVEYIFIVALCLSFLLFCFGLMMYGSHHTEAIDIVDNGYSPFASEHSLTLIFLFGTALFGSIKLWLKGRSLPPLLFVLTLIFAVLGIIISFFVLLQISSNTQFYDAWLFGFLPVTNIITAITLIYKVIAEEATEASNKTYRNKFLNYLNQKMAHTAHQPLYVIILLVPIWIMIVAILMLFGQEADSISKVFTETTTWNFSTKTHPPFLDHRGHYLCTVAICGDPKVVKPLRLGKRHGYEIVVNRQLLIANAFEELISESWPAAHKIIRGLYDKYGYPLSKKVTSVERSNLVYRLMKPLEYFFLLCLYLYSEKPEEKIARQYQS